MKLKRRVMLVPLILAGALAGAESKKATANPPPADSDELYKLGAQLFEQLAPPEVKAQFEFPTKEQWDAFAVRLQRALEGNSLEELAGYLPEARSAQSALRTLGYEDMADWLEQRIDEIDVARQLAEGSKAQTPKGQTPKIVTPPPGKSPVPYYDLWLARVRNRPAPANASVLIPKLRAAFQAEGVPGELAWIAEAESSLNPAARSPAGAKGLFQFMPDTAQSLGLSTFLPDERSDPEKSARAAARYLRMLHGKFGNWPLVLAAYNAGEGRVSRALAAKKAQDFATVADALPAETRMYVPKVCALITTRAGVPLERIGQAR